MICDDVAMSSVDLPRRSLPREAKRVLLERISTGFYAPGERLIETRIAREFGVSQNVIREALRELEATRLVETTPHRGASVRTVSPDELRHAHGARAALESHAAFHAAEQGIDVAPLEESYARMEAGAVRGSREEYVDASVDFHRAILHAAGNPLVLEMWESLRIETRTTFEVLHDDFDLVEAARSHAPLIDALRQRDAERAATLSREHSESFARRVVADE
jgi:DNA-binding GntR family transcriptional regulator